MYNIKKMDVITKCCWNNASDINHHCSELTTEHHNGCRLFKVKSNQLDLCINH